MTASPTSAARSIAAQIAALPDVPIGDVRALWKKLFGTEPPNSNSRPIMERRIAYRLQETEFRKQDAAMLERNKRHIAALIEKGKNVRPRVYTPVPGTVLVRRYRDQEHRVTVLLDGQFEYLGQPYGSLSQVARKITGQTWSGPLFFGLRASPHLERKKPRKGAKA